MDSIPEVVNANCRETRNDVSISHRETENNVNDKASDARTENNLAIKMLLHCLRYCRVGGTGPADTATAEPKSQKPTIQNFSLFIRYTDSFS